ncbi:MAG: helix-turn-helix transcriptional regulator [Caldilineaceae bacterium]|nr:helix-turn-helix transcriptional regulator [Caldilineaceae bacterium]
MTKTTTADLPATTVATNLNVPIDGASLAEQANYSRFHFQRLFREQTGETPGDCRRRLLLERAGYQLRHTSLPVTDIAFEALYESLEGFSRAFRRAHGVSPSHYRRLEPLSWLLPAPNDIHYDPVIGAAVRLSQPKTEGGPMHLTDRLVEHDLWLTRCLLERAMTLTDDQFDAPLAQPEQPVPFDQVEQSIRDVLERLVYTKEVWVAAVLGRKLPDHQDRSAAGLLQRMDASFGEFRALVQRVQADNLWDVEFVDMICEPPERFTYGGMIAHVLTFAAYRRTVALQALARLGVTDLGYGDPIEWELQLSANSPTEH